MAVTRSFGTESGDGGCALSSLRPFSSLSVPLVLELEKICQRKVYPAGRTVLDAGEESDFFGCVKQGILCMQKTRQDGRKQIVGLLAEGDMFGRMFDGASDFTVEAATEASICRFRRGPFEDLLTRSLELERFVLLQLMKELDRARDWMVILLNRKVTGRLAGFLVVLCTRFAKVDHLIRPENGSLELRVPVNRGDLAGLLGTRVESISRAFGALAKDEIIRIKTPYLIEVLDIERLVEEAGEEFAPSLKDIEQLVWS